MTPDELRARATAHNDRQPARRPAATPPVETGERLATIERGPDEQIRVCWCTYENKPYVSLRLWKRSHDGSWWPDAKRGMSIRIRELGALGEALAAAMDRAAEVSSSAARAPSGGPAPAHGQGNGARSQGGAPGRPGATGHVPPGRERRSWSSDGLPPAQPASADPHFDEFSDSSPA
jgi:hypothetical protein